MPFGRAGRRWRHYHTKTPLLGTTSYRLHLRLLRISRFEKTTRAGALAPEKYGITVITSEVKEANHRSSTICLLSVNKMAPLVLLIVAEEKEMPDFRDAVEACRAAGPLKVYSATKAVEAASQLNVRLRRKCSPTLHVVIRQFHELAEGHPTERHIARRTAAQRILLQGKGRVRR